MFTREEARALGITKLLPPDDPWHEPGGDKPGAKPKPPRVRVNDAGMNKTEAAWAQRLEGLKASGNVLAWWFEPFKLPLAGRCTYRPDFLAITRKGFVCAFEVKGFMRDDAAVKLKVAAARFSEWQWFLVRRVGRLGWEIRQVNERGISTTVLSDAWLERCQEGG